MVLFVLLTNSWMCLGLQRHLMSKKQAHFPCDFNIIFTSPWALEGYFHLTRWLLFWLFVVFLMVQNNSSCALTVLKYCVTLPIQ